MFYLMTGGCFCAGYDLKALASFDMKDFGVELESVDLSKSRLMVGCYDIYR